MYSLGAIDRAKADHHRLIEPGMRVLYAGAGRGREIVGACQRGAEAVCIEPCPTMSEALHRRLAESCEGFTIVPRPIQSVPPDPAYDLVVAHFFLNVFDTASMPGVLKHLCRFVKPGGRLVIADFEPATEQARLSDRAMRQAYYRPLNLAGRLLRICALHPIYDYAPLLTEHGLPLESRQGLRVCAGLPTLYEVMVARRQ